MAWRLNATCFHLQGQGDPLPLTLKKREKLRAFDLLGILNKTNRHPPYQHSNKEKCLMRCENMRKVAAVGTDVEGHYGEGGLVDTRVET